MWIGFTPIVNKYVFNNIERINMIIEAGGIFLASKELSAFLEWS